MRAGGDEEKRGRSKVLHSECSESDKQRFRGLAAIIPQENDFHCNKMIS